MADVLALEAASTMSADLEPPSVYETRGIDHV
jgi:hypothetical protein